MTSMPASRSARAMIFAPRSCPSRPGLATTTRILRFDTRRSLDDHRVAGEAVLDGDALEDLAHRLDARGAVAGGVRGDRDGPRRAVGQRAQHDVVAHPGEADRRG